MCFFCEKPEAEEGTSSLHNVSTFELDTRVRQCAYQLQDQRLLAKLSGGDLIAQEAKYHLQCLVSQPVSSIHSYNTRLASKSSLYLPHARTNYGIFNIRYNGAKIWNTIDIEVRNLPKKHFIKKLKNNYLNTYIP